MLLLGVIFSLSVACSEKQVAVEADNQVADFMGKAFYSVEAISERQLDVSTFYRFNPGKIEIGFGDSVVRIVESGGSSKGNILIDLRKTTAWQIDTAERAVYQGNYSDLSDAPAALKATMPDHFKAVLQPTGAEKLIGGWNCTGYEVVRSGFIRPGVPTTVWVTRDILLPGCRYDVETDVNMVSAPLPLYMGVAEGTVVMLEYTLDDLLVRYTLDSVAALSPKDDFFTLPTSYRFQ